MPGFENLLNVHPLFVHFPIAMTMLALLFEVLYLSLKKDQFRNTATALIYLSMLAAVAAVVTGYIAADTIGHESPGHDMVHTHRDFMVWFTGVIVVLALMQAILTYVKSLNAEALWWSRLGRPVLLTVAAVILILGADRGGRLVFQYGIGVEMEAPSAELNHDHSTHQNDSIEAPSEARENVKTDHHDNHDHDHNP